MGTTSALKQPVVSKGLSATARRVLFVALLVIALTVAAFAIGRAFGGGGAAATNVTPAHQSSTFLGQNNCRVGQPC
jgi:hypothetical protein